jgi:predicted nucleotidyltransferase
MGVPGHYPDEVREALEALLDGLADLGEAVLAVVVYGSVARGDYRSSESDINVATVLREADRNTLARLRPVLRRAWLSSRVAAFVVTKQEIAQVTDAFPVKLADIQRSHDLIQGSEDPFVDLAIDPEHFRIRTEQELRNHLLRLRRHYLRVGDDAAALSDALYGSLASFAIELWALSCAVGDELADEDRGRWLELAGERFELHLPTMKALASVHRGETMAEDELVDLYFGLMDQLTRAVAVVDEVNA